VILDATLEVLAEVGYTGLTMDMVATHAKAGKATVYRRWPSKTELILDAIARLKSSQVDLQKLPDTGTLRGDLLGIFQPEPADQAERRLQIMAGLSSVLSSDLEFADAANAAVVEPWAEAHLIFLQRAVARGEISASSDIMTLSRLIPSMAAYRALIQRKPFEREFLTSMVDSVVLPAVGIRPDVIERPR
jgi:AcrR family transcriptional regulator